MPYCPCLLCISIPVTLPPLRKGKEDFMPVHSADIAWYVVQTRPNQEAKVKSLMDGERARRSNLLETYCPTNKVVRMQHGGKVELRPLFARKVFVLGARDDIRAALSDAYPEGYLAYDKTQERVMTIPELQMLFFMDFNEHYPEKVLVLERPYADYAFNRKIGEANETVAVLDGPFAGKTGYLIRSRNNRRLVFQMHGMAVSIPDVWNYRLVRLHNQKGDRQSKGTLKGRAVDYLVGILQGCGYWQEVPSMMRLIMEQLGQVPSIVKLAKSLQPEMCTAAPLQQNAKTEADSTTKLAARLLRLSPDGASTLLFLSRLYSENTTFLDGLDEGIRLRPFLTPTAGLEEQQEQATALFQRSASVWEVIRRESFDENTFCSEQDCAREMPVVYYSHVGIVRKENGNYTVFANWHPLLSEYLLLGGEAKERQLETFRTFSPQLYEVLSGNSRVKIEKNMRVEDRTGHTLCIHVKTLSGTYEDGMPLPAEVLCAAAELSDACLGICREINANAHLALWRRLLRGVWLHM